MVVVVRPSSDFVEVEGLRELRRDMRRAGVDYAELRGVGEKAARPVVEEGRHTVPYLTGATYGTIRAAGQAGGAVVRAGGPGARRYPPVVHFGWPAHNIAPNPYLFEAADARRFDVVRIYDENVNRIARQHFGRRATRP